MGLPTTVVSSPSSWAWAASDRPNGPAPTISRSASDMLPPAAPYAPTQQMSRGWETRPRFHIGVRGLDCVASVVQDALRSRSAFEAEILALRQQVTVLQYEADLLASLA